MLALLFCGSESVSFRVVALHDTFSPMSDVQRSATLDAPTVCCKCLNVKFSTDCLTALASETELSKVSLSEARSFVNPCTVNQQKRPLGDVAQITYQSLVTVKQSGRWKIYRCYNCQTTTHASSKEMDIINRGELVESLELLRDPRYSSLFSIILNKTPQGGKGKDLPKGSAIAAVWNIEERCSQFLNQEKERMNERIRQFEATENYKYQQLSDSVKEQQNYLAQQISAAYREGNEDTDSAYERSVEEIPTENDPTPTNKNGECNKDNSLCGGA